MFLLLISEVHGFTDSIHYSQNPIGAVSQLRGESSLSTRDGYFEFFFKQAPEGDKFRKFDWRSRGWDDNYLIAFYEQLGWSANIERILCFPVDPGTGRTISFTSVQSTEMLAHKMCRNEGYPTIQHTALIPTEKYKLITYTKLSTSPITIKATAPSIVNRGRIMK